MLEVIHIKKEYQPKKGQAVQALDDVSIKFPERGLVFILGKSGSGKSTLLNVLGGLDKVDSGEIIIKGKSSKDFSQSEFDSYRNTYLGFIFQEYNILNEFNVGDNIALALQLQGKKADAAAVEEILEEVDLAGHAKRKPMELSGGQKQRVAIARALIKNPEIILADEPTGALDSATGIQVFDTLKKLSAKKLIIVVSHDRDFAERYGDRVIELKDGKVIADDEKVSSAGKSVSEGFVSLGDKVFTIEKGHVLNEDDISYLNNVLKEQDAIVSCDPKSNRAVREANHLSETGEQNFFQHTDESKINYGDNNFKLIKSRLPASRAIKMGASALKSKPVRLFFTILLSTVALVLFGCVATMAAFNRAETVMTGLSYRDFDNGLADYYKKYTRDYGDGEEYSYYDQTTFGREELETFEKTYGIDADPLLGGGSYMGVSTSNNYLDSGVLMASDYSLYSLNAYGALRKSQAGLSELGYSFLAGSYPTSPDEIMITDYILLSFQQAGYIDYTQNPVVKIEARNVTAQAMVGQNLSVSLDGYTGQFYKISGVLNTNTDYEKIYPNFASTEIDYGFINQNQNLVNEMRYRCKRNYPNCVYVGESFPYAKEQGTARWLSGSDFDNFNLDSSLYVETGSGDKIYFYDYASGFGYLGLLDQSKIEWLGSSKTALAENEILLPIAAKNYFNETPTAPISVNGNFSYGEDWLNHTQRSNLVIVGFYDDPDAPSAIVFSDAIFQDLAQYAAKPYRNLLFRYENVSQLRKLVQDSCNYQEAGVDYSFCFENEAMESGNLIFGLVEVFTDILLYVAIALAAFSGLLMANFISTSIAYKKREIGILRAVGARSSDVFGIFFSEATIIALIEFVLSFFGTLALMIYFNIYISAETGILGSTFVFGPLQWLIMIGIALGVAFLASFIPVFLVARKRPVDAIRSVV